MRVSAFLRVRRLVVSLLLLSSGVVAVGLSPYQSLRANLGTALHYRFYCAFGNNSPLSGVMVVKMSGDTVRGTVLNEFGVRAFDIECAPGRNKAKISNVIKPMNKWYIRRTLSKDIYRLLQSDTSTLTTKRVSYSLTNLNNL